MSTPSLVRVVVIVLGAALASCTSRSENTAPPDSKDNSPSAFGSMTVSPDSGHARDQVFTVRLQRTAGSPVPHLIGLLVSEGAAGTGACYVFNVSGTPRLLLVNDNGVGSQEAAAASAVSNTQCDAVADQPASSVTDDAVTVTFHLRFKPGFTGSKQLYLIAQDAAGAGTGLRRAGQFTLE
jgi:hypothetical protein